MDNWPPNTSVVVKSDTKNSTTTKPIQLSKKDLKLCNDKLVKNDDINNRLSIYHQNIRSIKGKIDEFLMSLPAEAPHFDLSHGTSFERI